MDCSQIYMTTEQVMTGGVPPCGQQGREQLLYVTSLFSTLHAVCFNPCPATPIYIYGFKLIFYQILYHDAQLVK